MAMDNVLKVVFVLFMMWSYCDCQDFCTNPDAFNKVCPRLDRWAADKWPISPSACRFTQHFMVFFGELCHHDPKYREQHEQFYKEIDEFEKKVTELCGVLPEPSSTIDPNRLTKLEKEVECSMLKFKESCQFEDIEEYIAIGKFFPDKKSLPEYCRKTAKFLECGRGFVKKCMGNMVLDIFEVLLMGPITLNKEVCTPSSELSKRLLEHTPCLKNITEAISECYEPLEKDFMRNIFNESSGSSILGAMQSLRNTSCCGYKESMECQLDLVETNCGVEAAKFVKKCHHLGLSPYIAQQCEGQSCFRDFYRTDAPTKRNGQCGTSAGSLYIAIMFVVMVHFRHPLKL